MTRPDARRATVVVATGSREAAEVAARRAGLDPVAVVTKSECLDRETLRRVRALGAGGVAIHSRDWCHEPMPQSYEVAAALVHGGDLPVIGSEGEVLRQFTPVQRAARLAALPFEVGRGGAMAGIEAAHLARLRRRPGRAARARGIGDGPVLAVWTGPGAGAQVGGAVTHVSGVLGGFRRLGLRVVLVTVDAPPQLEAVVDDVVALPPLPRHERVTADVTAVGRNRQIRRLLRRTAAALGPAFVYQRNDVYATAGVEVAHELGLPVVLEWNGSLVWTHTHWNTMRPLNRAFLPLLAATERHVAGRADLVSAVSEHAAAMARAAGAPDERVVVVPNAVDVDAVDALRETAPAPVPGTVGWVGSFGPWHGAEVLVAALARLGDGVRAVMIGDGKERPACEALARDLGVHHRIEWTGTVAHDEAIRRLLACDLLASPHVPLEGQPFFGSPTKLFEYLAIGRPIVASALEQLDEVLEDGRTARLVRPGDPADLARGIEWLLADRGRAEALGAAARAESAARHRWEDRAATILHGLDGRRAAIPVAVAA